MPTPSHYLNEKQLLDKLVIDGVRKNYGWHTQDEGEEQATGENGPFSVLEYVQYMSKPKVWGDSIMIQLISSMLGCRVTILRN